MVLQSSGPISLSDIQSEFDGSNPISISEYYGADAALPDSGTISIGDFYGLYSPPVITLNGDNPYLVPLGDSFSDPGATADGGETVSVNTSNLTSTIQTSGGNGDVVYSATDAAGNIGYAIRTVKYPLRDPTSGDTSNVTTGSETYYYYPGFCPTGYGIYWDGVLIHSSSSEFTSVTSGDYTYYKGTYLHPYFSAVTCGGPPYAHGGYRHAVYRSRYV